jgi:iron(III) transport system permease protein
VSSLIDLSSSARRGVRSHRAKALQIAAFGLGVLVAMPIITVLVLALRGGADNWSRIFSVQLANSLPATLHLLILCGLLSGLIGGVLAWLVTFFEFPGRRILQALAYLPLAMPGYIIAFVMTEQLSFSGPVQGWWRGVFGFLTPQDYWFPAVRSVTGAAVVLAFVLYPYVYATARAAFLKQSPSQLDAARSLGKTRAQAMISIALPQAAPAIAIGMILVMLETLNDIGAATFFGVQTVTASIYALWLDQGNLAGAAQLSLLALATVTGLMLIERQAQARDHLFHGDAKPKQLERLELRGARAWLASVVVFVPILVGFIWPALVLLRSALKRIGGLVDPDFLSALAHSIELAAIASLVTIVAGMILAYAARIFAGSGFRLVETLASLGYAVPGTVLALGVLVPLGQIDQLVNRVTEGLFDARPGLIFSGTVFALVFAYLVRFLTLSFRTLENGMALLTANLDAAARTMGRSAWRRFVDIHLPILRPSIATALILVFVDAMKELPATLLLRPFDFETLATHLFSLASLGQLEDAALPALAIVAVGLVPVFLLSRGLETRKN